MLPSERAREGEKRREEKRREEQGRGWGSVGSLGRGIEKGLWQCQIKRSAKLREKLPPPELQLP